ncbi:MAG: XdhC family protein [Desulfobulbus oligotrophicus]|nr:XdhC family protein [Desulfobulbus oligotrophicus]
MKRLVRHLCSTLADNRSCVLATVGSQSGSTPRIAGTKMIVHEGGSIFGTIGGGLVEATAIREAASCLLQKKSAHKRFDLSNSEAAVSDMICGGTMDLYLEYIAPSSENMAVFQQLEKELHAGRRVILVSSINGEQPRFFVDHKGRVNREDLPSAVASLCRQTAAVLSGAACVDCEGEQYLLSSFATGGHLVLVGAGHVAACTAEAAARVGFQVTVMDDREEFANKERFPQATTIQLLSTFAGCLDGLDIDSDTYVVIVTRGHLHDMEVLEQTLQTRAGYIGMIGSRRKRNTIYTQLLDKGVTEAQLGQVRCPIGMAIEADTPEEIAVSIVGELIYQRATGRRAWHLA